MVGLFAIEDGSSKRKGTDNVLPYATKAAAVTITAGRRTRRPMAGSFDCEVGTRRCPTRLTTTQGRPPARSPGTAFDQDRPAREPVRTAFIWSGKEVAASITPSDAAFRGPAIKFQCRPAGQTGSAVEINPERRIVEIREVQISAPVVSD